MKDCAEFAPNTTAYMLKFTEYVWLQTMNHWLFGVACKVLPCLALSAVSILLIIDLRRAQERRR